jgi:hypothetical protein
MNGDGQQARKRRSGIGTIVRRHGAAMSLALALFGVMSSTDGWSESSGAADVSALGAVKWHPGHYYAPMSFMRKNPKIMALVYSELRATPALRGLQVRYRAGLNWNLRKAGMTLRRSSRC